MIDNFPEIRAERFVAKYPQFSAAGSLLIEAIKHALEQVDEARYGQYTDTAIELIAADWLSNHEYGQSLRSDGKPSDYYAKQLEAIRRRIAQRMIVI